MELIKKNIEKKREVYKLDDRYRKVWYIHDEFALEEHISILAVSYTHLTLPTICSV